MCKGLPFVYPVKTIGIFWCFVFVVTAGSTAASDVTRAKGNAAARVFRQEGTAVYYSSRFQGRKTASGERFDIHAFTAAHRTLRFDSRVLVTNLGNNKSVVVRINDRGPFGGKGHIIDLSPAAARAIGLGRRGTARVKLQVEQ
jgi:rare lipoprotein A